MRPVKVTRPDGRRASERRLHLAPGGAIPRHNQMPARRRENGAAERFREHLEGGELAPAAHHRDAKKPRLARRNAPALRDRIAHARLSRSGGRLARGGRFGHRRRLRGFHQLRCFQPVTPPVRRDAAGTEKGRKHRDPRRILRCLPQARHIVAVEREDRVRAPDGARRRLVSDAPGSALLLRRVRCLGHHVRDTEAIADGRSQPVRRLVIEVIGEPEEGAALLRPVPVAAHQPIRQPPTRIAEPPLSFGIARTVEAAEVGSHFDLPPSHGAGPPEGGEKEPREGAVARGNRVVGSLERGVERDSHAAGIPDLTASERK